MKTVGLEPTNPEDHGLNVARLTTSLRLRLFRKVMNFEKNQQQRSDLILLCTANFSLSFIVFPFAYFPELSPAFVFFTFLHYFLMV